MSYSIISLTIAYLTTSSFAKASAARAFCSLLISVPNPSSYVATRYGIQFFSLNRLKTSQIA